MTRSCRLLVSVILATFAAVLLPSATQGQANNCARLQRMITDTYNFKPSKLNKAEQTAKSNAMDRVWEAVKTDRAKLLPCLRSALADLTADQFFLFDGSNLLLSLDPSEDSKLTLIRSYALVDLADVDLRVWVGQLALLGAEGFDISQAADKWLRFPNAFYYLPQHGAYKVTVGNGGMFLFGSMDEAQATPVLLRIASDKNHPGRETALWALMNQATPESLKALKQVDSRRFSPPAQRSLNALLRGPQILEPRKNPKNTRAEFVTAFEKLLKGDWAPFQDLVSQTPDGERDVVAVLKPEDVPLVRRVRRRIIANGNQHAIEFYNSFSSILMTMILKPTLTE
jgi:hypothetical protein